MGQSLHSGILADCQLGSGDCHPHEPQCILASTALHTPTFTGQSPLKEQVQKCRLNFFFCTDRQKDKDTERQRRAEQNRAKQSRGEESRSSFKVFKLQEAGSSGTASTQQRQLLVILAEYPTTAGSTQCS